MTPNEYQELANRTNDGLCGDRLASAVCESPHLATVLNGCLGLSGECGEFNDMIKKWIFHDSGIDEQHLEKELGDILWYIALICNAMGWKLENIMQQNIKKLKTRYPEGFDTYLANHRMQGDV